MKKRTPEQTAKRLIKQRNKAFRHQHEMVKAERTRPIRGRAGRRLKKYKPAAYERLCAFCGRATI
jgi:hypothetical protein